MDDVLVYNAVPKCGSTSFTYLMVKLAERNGFDFEKQVGWRGFAGPDFSVQEEVRENVEV